MNHFILTHPQMRIWYNEKIYKHSSMHNITGVARIKKEIDFQILERAINYFLMNNDAVRIKIDEKNGEPSQYICEYKEFKVDFYDFSIDVNPRLSFEKWLDYEKKKPFNLLNSELYYFAIFKIANNDTGYLARFHHIICDGWAVNIAGKQISQFYTGLINQKQVEVEEMYSYLSFIDQEKTYLKSERCMESKSYWNKKYEILPDIIRLSKSGNLTALRRTFDIDWEMSFRIKKAVNENHFSINSFFVGVFLIYLYLTTGERDLIIGTPVMNRTGKKERNTFGMFTSTMPFRFQVNEALTIREFIQNIGVELKRCYIHQKYPYDFLVSDIELQKHGYDRLFDICVNYYNMKFSNIFDGSPAENIEIFNGTQPYALQFVIRDWEDDGKLMIDFDYREDEYSQSRIEAMFKHICNIINGILQQPETLLHDIEMLSEIEKESLLYEFNNTKMEYPSSKTVIQLFEEQVEKEPDKTACILDDNSLSYHLLNEKSNSLARFLRNKGVFKDTIVGVMADHSFELMIAILSVLKAGGAYLPIDSKAPGDRISFMLEDSEALILLSFSAESKEFDFEGEIFKLDDDQLYLANTSNLEPASEPRNLAYTIYTSGSTGKPKGVAVEHIGLQNYIWWADKKYVSGQPHIFALYTSIAFDLTVTSIFTPLIAGNSIAIYPEDTGEFPLYRIMRENKTTIVKLTPSHLHLIKDLDNKNSRIKKFIIGGEDLKVSLARSIHESFGGQIEIFNEYGPTETVVGCMIHKYDYFKDIRDSVPIGVPADNTTIYLLDQRLKPVPVCTPGEIYISGAGVARGYLKRSELTRERFLENPFIKGERMYKTGDSGVMLEENIIEYAGRVDNQVKIRGYRIELGEIEAAILKYAGVKNAAVKVINDEKQSKFLCVYYVHDESVMEEAIREFLHQILPDYMIPSFFVDIDSMPLTSNGKIDFKSLPVPDFTCCLLEKWEAPRNETEEIMLKAWQEIFVTKNIGIHDNFFSLGGDSIKAIQLMSKLSQYGVEVTVKEIMTHQSISQLSPHARKIKNSITQGISGGAVKQTPIVTWFLTRKFENLNHFNQSVTLSLKKDIDRALIGKAFDKIIEHHDSLRLNLDRDNHLFYNNEILVNSFQLEYLDASNFSGETQDAEIVKFKKTLKSDLNLYGGLPLKAAVIDLRDGKRHMLITAHHLAVDGISWRIILEDLFNVYESLSSGKEVRLPKKTHSFQHFSETIDQYSWDKELQKEVSFWNPIISHEERLPQDFEADTICHGTVNEIGGELDREVTGKLLSEANRAYHTETIVLLLTALALTVKKWSGFESFTYEIENHGRHLETIDISRTVGWFTVMHPLRITLLENDLEKQILSVKEQFRKIPGKGMGYGILKYHAQAFQPYEEKTTEIRFNYLGQFDSSIGHEYFQLVNDGVKDDISDVNVLTAKLEINCMIMDLHFIISLKYSNRMYREDSVKTFLDYYMGYLKEIIAFASNQEEIHFTTSDFELAAVSQEDLDLLLGG